MPRELSSSPSNFKTEHPSLPDRDAHERALDETLAETFPASDPLSSIPDPASDDPLAA